MQDDNPQPQQLDPRLERALAHRPRLEIFGYLMQERGGRGTGERELAGALGLSIRLVEYHLKVLHDAGLIAHAEDERARSYVAAAAAGR